MSALYILTNEDICAPTAENRRYGHLGTRDRDDPTVSYDHPGKANALLKAAYDLRDSLTAKSTSSQPSTVTISVSTRSATRSELLKGHPEHYLAAFELAAKEARERVERGGAPIAPFGREADISAGTHAAAIRSVGASLDAIDVILDKKDSTAFALVWPPGHHAEPNLAMGFCYLSTAALAALYARDHTTQVRHGHKNRVVLIDIDHHRGNGTAAVLADKDEILFVDQAYKSSYDHATQRYTDGAYDTTTDRYIGAAREFPYPYDDRTLGITGHPMVSANNVVKFEFEGFQAADTILKRFIAEVLPQIIAFQPDVVMWSVGLDSAKGDPLGGLGMEPESFYTLIQGLRLALPHARHCGILEGGYDPQISVSCLLPTLLALCDSPETVSYNSFKNYSKLFSAPPATLPT